MKISSWLPSLERAVWYVFLALCTWQTRWIFWTHDLQFSEWNSMALYASDVVLLALFAIACIRLRAWFVGRLDVWDWSLGVVLAMSLGSLMYARELPIALYSIARLIEGALLYLYLRHYAWHVFPADSSALAFVVGALLQASLGIAQFVLQHDVGLRWLGETLLSPDMRGVAVFYDLSQVKVLRAYGTLPHPNILAAVLMVALWVGAWFWMRHDDESPLTMGIYSATMGILTLGLVVTFSRTIIAVHATALVAVLGYVAYRAYRGASWWRAIRVRFLRFFAALTISSAVICLALSSLIVARISISSSDEAVRYRVQYNIDALASGSRAILNVNWFGVGIGNFPMWLAQYNPDLPRYMYQPAHNVYLLMYSEIGIIGVIALIAWMAYCIRARMRTRGEPLIRFALIMLALSIGAIAAFDHFTWTLQQGRLLWWGVWALIAGIAGRASVPYNKRHANISHH